MNFNSHSLFAGTHPTRVFLALVESSKAAGTQESSPFEFYRSWSYKAGSQISNVQNEVSNNLDPRVNEMQELLYNFLMEQEGNGNTRKGKRSPRQTSKSSTSKSLLERAKKLFNRDLDDEASSISSRCSTFDPMPGPSNQQGNVGDVPVTPLTPATDSTEKIVYLTKCQLTIDTQDLGNKKRSLSL